MLISEKRPAEEEEETWRQKRMSQMKYHCEEKEKSLRSMINIRGALEKSLYDNELQFQAK